MALVGWPSQILSQVRSDQLRSQDLTQVTLQVMTLELKCLTVVTLLLLPLLLPLTFGLACIHLVITFTNSQLTPLPLPLPYKPLIPPSPLPSLFQFFILTIPNSTNLTHLILGTSLHVLRALVFSAITGLNSSSSSSVKFCVIF